MRILPSIALGGALGLAPFLGGASCTARALCEKEAQCLEEEFDIELEADSIRVCVVENEAALDALNANEEDECHALAAAQLALDNCRASLDCDDFFEDDLGGKCDEQFDDLEDAREDVDGNECTAQD